MRVVSLVCLFVVFAGATATPGNGAVATALRTARSGDSGTVRDSARLGCGRVALGPALEATFFVDGGTALGPALVAASLGNGGLTLGPALAAARDSVDIEIPLDRDKAILKGEMAKFGEVEVPGQRRWQRRKSAKVAIYSSMLLPTLGQVYNGRRWKAVAMAGFSTYYMGNIWLQSKKRLEFIRQRDAYEPNSLEWRQLNLWVEYHKKTKEDFAWWSGAVWLLGVLDAFVDAHLYDMRSLNPTVIEGQDRQQYVGMSVGF